MNKNKIRTILNKKKKKNTMIKSKMQRKSKRK